MFRHSIMLLALLLAWGTGVCESSAVDARLLQEPWLEVSTAHFNFYSCGPIGGGYKMAAPFGQVSSASAQVAGTQAVPSPPIVVMVFPNHESMKPFLPLYNGQPANMAAFFQHG